jgi:hypothetical protein
MSFPWTLQMEKTSSWKRVEEYRINIPSQQFKKNKTAFLSISVWYGSHQTVFVLRVAHFPAGSDIVKRVNTGTKTPAISVTSECGFCLLIFVEVITAHSLAFTLIIHNTCFFSNT